MGSKNLLVVKSAMIRATRAQKMRLNLRFSITVFSDIYLLQTTIASKNVMRYKSLIETHHIQVQVQFQLF